MNLICTTLCLKILIQIDMFNVSVQESHNFIFHPNQCQQSSTEELNSHGIEASRTLVSSCAGCADEWEVIELMGKAVWNEGVHDSFLNVTVIPWLFDRLNFSLLSTQKTVDTKAVIEGLSMLKLNRQDLQFI